MKCKSIITFLCLTLMFFACFRLVDSSISGYVIVDGSENPISGAKVHLVHLGGSTDTKGDGFLSTTNDEGYYWMNQIMMNGKLELIVRKEGFKEKRDTLELDNGKDYSRNFKLVAEQILDTLSK